MRKFLRRLGIGLGVLVLLLCVTAAGLYVVGGRKLARPYAVTAHPPSEVTPDSVLLARGEHLATAIAKCAACHGDDFGGRIMIDDPALGRAVPANLTRGRGGIGAEYTLADWERAVRHGVARDGRGLVAMPAEDWVGMSDADLLALVAYLRQVPPVDRELPPTQLRLVGRALFAMNQLPFVPAARIDHDRAPESPVPGPTAEYGRYLASVGGCTGCHGPTLAGGPMGGPGAPLASNLTPRGLSQYTEAAFFTALRDGIKPGGLPIKAPMPIEYTKRMTDDEIRALWAYLQTVPPREYGER